VLSAVIVLSTQASCAPNSPHGATPSFGLSTDSPAIAQEARNLEAAGFSAQAALLSDGVVSSDDYRRAIDNYSDCLVAVGMSITIPRLSPVDGFSFDFAVNHGSLKDDAALEVEEKCRQEHLGKVEAYWAAINTQVMDLSLRDAGAACAEKQGIDVGEESSNFREMAGKCANWDSDEERHRFEVVDQCLGTEYWRLFPDADMMGAGC
jgi:hypothetical protein